VPKPIAIGISPRIVVSAVISTGRRRVTEASVIASVLCLPSILRMKALNYFNYVSVITLFDSTSILDGTTTYLWKFAILFGIGFVCYLIGAIRFRKKDLPL